MKLLILISLIFLSSITYAEDKIACADEINNNVEIYKLFSHVKNEILGTTPKFCRTDKHAQLSDELDEGEKSLDEFVVNLKSFRPNTPDTLKIKLDDEVVVNRTIFNTFKMLILKKMWQQSSSDNQYSLLIAPECSVLGLNRLPIQKRSSSSQDVIERNKDGALEATKNVCTSSKFSEIAPYVSKDVLAEALLNLKNVFPQSFPQMVDSVCKNLNTTNELIFKNDKYQDFSIGELSVDSARDFTAWLKSIYAEASRTEALEQKKKESEHDEWEPPYDPAKDPLVAYQKELKEAFEKGNASGKLKEVKHPYNFGYVIKKNSQGIYLQVPGKDKKKELEKADAERDKQQREIIDNYIQNTLSNTPKKLKTIYEKGQVAGAPEVPVEDPENPGFFVAKNNKGEYYYKPHKSLLNAVARKMEEADQEWRSKYTQNRLKKIYETQLKYTDDDDGKSYPLLGLEKVILGKDGLYRNEKTGINMYQDNAYKLVSEKFTAKDSKDPIPGSFPGTAIVLDKDGNYKFISVPPINYNPVEEIQKAPVVTNPITEKDITERLDTFILKKYQEKSSDLSKIKDLDESEVAELKSYTSGGFRDLNTCLRKGNCSEDEDIRVMVLLSALQKIKREKWSDVDDYQIIFRGTSGLPASVKQSLKNEKEEFVLDKGFMSSTGDMELAKTFAGAMGGVVGPGQTVFIMKTKSCIGISALSSIEREDEFLCPPGMKFKSRQKKDNPSYYIIEEVD